MKQAMSNISKEIFEFLLRHNLIWKDKEYDSEGRACYRLRHSTGCGLCFYPDRSEFGQRNQFYSTLKAAKDSWSNCIKNRIIEEKIRLKDIKRDVRDLEAKLKAGKPNG